jgi:hypothetical protein
MTVDLAINSSELQRVFSRHGTPMITILADGHTQVSRRGIDYRTRVALRQDEAVGSGVTRIGRIVPHMLVE